MTATPLHQTASLQHQPPESMPVKPVAELLLTGDLDMENATELERYLTGGIERGCDLVIDLTEVRLIDCVCLDVLVQASRAAHALDCTLSLVAPSKLVRMTLQFTETDHLFAIVDGRQR